MADTRAPGPDTARRRPGLARPLAAAAALAWLLLCWAGYAAWTRDQAASGLWGCEMAYMYPSYERVLWPGAEGERYRVFLYREGGRDPSSPLGTPIIFLPGNAGDMKQVRSIASSASHLFFGKTKHSWTRPLDFFAFDFNEDLSALHAPTLEEQARFVAAAVPHVLDAAYASKPAAERPTRVTLLGHSMGGVVARLAALQLGTSLAPISVDAILTMSSPHALPPLTFEPHMDALYGRINGVTHSRPAPLLISICGGVADTQIVSDSCALPDSLLGPEDGFAVFSTDIPGAWTGVEHQAMVWCDQVRWRVARALLDMAHAHSREDRLGEARRWLLAGAGAAQSTGPAVWHTEELPVVAANMSVLVQLPPGEMTEGSLVDPPVRVEHCDAGRCAPVAYTTRAVPRPAVPADPFPFPGEGCKAAESAVVVDVRGLPLRGNVRVELPRDSVVSGGQWAHHDVGSAWRRTNGESAPAHLSLRFDRAVSSLLVYRLHTEVGDCTGPPPVIHHTAPPAAGWSLSYEARFFPSTSSPVTLHSHVSGAPFQGPSQSSRGVEVHVYQQPRCAVRRVALALDLGATVAKAMLRFRTAAVAWGAGWVAVLLFHQLRAYDATGTMPALGAVIETTLSRNLLAACAILVAAPLLQTIASLFVAPEQLFLGTTQLAAVPLGMLVAAWSLGLVVVLHGLLGASVALSARLFFRRTTHARAERAEESINATRWTLVARAAPALFVVALVKLAIPWRMAFVVLYLVQYALVARSARDVEQPARHRLSSTLLLLMTLLLPLTAPAVAVWARNLWFRHGHPFGSDHAVLPLVPVLCAVQAASSDAPLPRARILTRTALGAAALLALAAAAAAPRRAYVLLPTSGLVFLSTAALLAPLPLKRWGGGRAAREAAAAHERGL